MSTDTVTRRERMQSFEIKPQPFWPELLLVAGCVGLLYLTFQYIEQVESFLMWVGL